MADQYVDWLEGMPGKGPLPADWAIVGISPSTKRPAHRRLEPFGSASYNIIENLRRKLKGSLYVTNAVKEPHDPGKQPGMSMIRKWSSTLKEELQLVQPSRILTLGSIPSKILASDYGFTDLTEDHGTFFWNSELKCWVIPTFHFSAGQRNPTYQNFIGRDIHRWLELPDPEAGVYHLVSSPDEMDIPMGGTIALDIETAGLEAHMRILSIGTVNMDVDDPPAYIIESPTQEDIANLGRIIKENRTTVVGHNLQFDLRFMIHHSGWKFPRVTPHDTMIMAHLAGEEKLSLKHLTTLHTDRPGSRFGGGIEDPLYLSEDVKSTGELFHHYQHTTKAYIYQHLRNLVPLMASVNLRGVYIDRDILREAHEHASEQFKYLESDLYDLSDISKNRRTVNWNSTQQVAAILQDSGIPLREKTKAGNVSIKESVLLPLREKYPLVDTLLKYRAEAKLISGFTGPYLERLTDADPYLHPTLKLTGTATGRLSCANPNLQQVPREGPLKGAFVPRPGYEGYGIVDLEQAELRIAALLSQDPVLIETLNSEDIHRTGAAQVLGIPPEEVTSLQRKAFKKVIFGLLYGGTPEGIAMKADISVQETVRIIQWIATNFKALSKWMKKQHRDAEETGEIITLFGRRRVVRDLLMKGEKNRVARLSVNTPIQSVASDCMLIVTATLDAELRRSGLKSRVLFGVHDSLLTEYGPGEGMKTAHLVQKAFEAIGDSPLGQLPLFKELPLTGTFILGSSWAAVESTNEAYAPGESLAVSSLSGGLTRNVALAKEDDDEVLDEEDDEEEDYDS